MAAAVLSPLGPMTMDAYEPQDDDTAAEAASCPDSLADEAKAEMPAEKDDSSSVPDLAEDDDAVAQDDVDMHDTTPPRPQSFSGLDNLGNTCYMSSALQMLASLDHFVSNLEDSPPRQQGRGKDTDGNHDRSNEELRQAFLELMQTLRQARETSTSPTAFKRAMDARSPLFVGYRQQDSHEFLTTLLDLLDEDYQKKQEIDENKTPESMETDPVEKEEVVHEEEEPVNDTEMGDRSEGPTADETTEEAESCADSSELSLQRFSSFSQLDADDISHLLHGSEKAKENGVPPATETMEPQCKLVGGRANVTVSDAALQLAVEDDRVSSSALAKMPQNLEADDESGERMDQDDEGEPSPVEDYFATKVRSRLTCDSCKYTRSHVEKFLHLSLDIGTDSGSVEDGLRKFFAPENREIKCEKCFCETATQTMEIVRLPRALLLHFKRFIVDVSPDYSSITYRKNQSPVHFGDKYSLDATSLLAEFVASVVEIPVALAQLSYEGDDDDNDKTDGYDEERLYHLKSVVNHIGSSASCGHYHATASRLYSSGEREWTRFNDSYVTKVSEQEAMGDAARRTAYLVMYELE